MNLRLAVVDVHAVIGYEGPGWRAVALGVDVLIEIVHAGQERRLRLHAVFARQQRADVCRLKLRAVGAGAFQSILQADRQTCRTRRRPPLRRASLCHGRPQQTTRCKATSMETALHMGNFECTGDDMNIR